MRYYISDCHFYHRSLLVSMDRRPFESVEAMNAFMIEKWNEKVRENDEVVILGDFSWGNAEETETLLKALHGKKYLIRGNHDLYLKDKKFDQSLFGWVKEYAELHDNKRKVVLSHYPIVCYNGQYRLNEAGQPKTWMLYGHIHNTHDQQLIDAYGKMVSQTTHRRIGSEEQVPIPIQMINVFCMRSGYQPLSLDEWIEVENARRQPLGLSLLGPAGEESVKGAGLEKESGLNPDKKTEGPANPNQSLGEARFMLQEKRETNDTEGIPADL